MGIYFLIILSIIKIYKKTKKRGRPRKKVCLKKNLTRSEFKIKNNQIQLIKSRKDITIPEIEIISMYDWPSSDENMIPTESNEELKDTVYLARHYRAEKREQLF